MNLKQILAKDPATLTEDEKALVRANAELLSTEEKAKFAEVLKVDTETASLLKSIGEIVETKTRDTLEKYGINGAPNKKIFPTGEVPATLEQKYEYVKSLMSDADRGYMNGLRTEEKKEEFLGKARIAYFFKNLVQFSLTKDPEHLAHVKALAEGTDADGGYLTPTEFRAQLVEDIKDKPFLRNLVTVIPMGSDNLELPTLASSVKTSWGSENTTISTTTARFGTLTFAPKRLNSLIYTSRELVSDSALSVVPLLTRLFVQAIGEEEDRVIINGSGSGQPKGILQETLAGIDNENTDANLPTNIKALPFRLGTAYRKNARWLINSLSLGAIAGLKDSNNQFLFKEGIEGLTPHRLAGYEVHEQSDVPLDTLLFGDLSFYYLADRERISVETTTEGAGTFEKHQVAIKVVERIDGKVALTLAFRKITNAGID